MEYRSLYSSTEYRRRRLSPTRVRRNDSPDSRTVHRARGSTLSASSGLVPLFPSRRDSRVLTVMRDRSRAVEIPKGVWLYLQRDNPFLRGGSRKDAKYSSMRAHGTQYRKEQASILLYHPAALSYRHHTGSDRHLPPSSEFNKILLNQFTQDYPGLPSRGDPRIPPGRAQGWSKPFASVASEENFAQKELASGASEENFAFARGNRLGFASQRLRCGLPADYPAITSG